DGGASRHKRHPPTRRCPAGSADLPGERGGELESRFLSRSPVAGGCFEGFGQVVQVDRFAHVVVESRLHAALLVTWAGHRGERDQPRPAAAWPAPADRL